MGAIFFTSQSFSQFKINLGETSAGNAFAEPRITDGIIIEFEDDPYRVSTPIPIRYERTENGYLVSFAEANMATSGISKADARQALEVEILDAFDDWTADETALGTTTRQQLAVLKRYIAKNR